MLNPCSESLIVCVIFPKYRNDIRTFNQEILERGMKTSNVAVFGFWLPMKQKQ